jgi:hypothetical protein
MNQQTAIQIFRYKKVLNDHIERLRAVARSDLDLSANEEQSE